MSDLTIFPADLAAMSTAQLVALPINDFVAAERNVDEATAYLKQLRAKLDAAKLQRYGEQARSALRDSGRDFGTAHVSDGALHVKYELAKKAKELNLDAIHDTVHEMAKDEARHGKALAGLLKRYF